MRAIHTALAAAVTALVMAAQPALAQQGDGPLNCDLNYNSAVETEKQREQRVFLETHAAARAIIGMFRKSCNAAEFLRKLGERKNPNAPLTNEEIADAATPDYPKSRAADEAIATARAGSRSSPRSALRRETFENADGSTWYFESRKDSRDKLGSNLVGTAIHSDGTIVRGTFTPIVRNGYVIERGRLNPGETLLREVYYFQEITADGQLRAGRVTSEALGMSGPGVSTYPEPDGRKSILEGTFVKGKPYDEMVRRYSDGRSRREFYKDGILQIVGEFSAPGGVPPPLTRPDVPVPVRNPWSMSEGLSIQTDGPHRERYLLSCNKQVIAVGDFGPKDQAPLPQPSECPNPQTYRDGMTLVMRANYQGRTEYWCRGQMIAATGWARYPPRQYVTPEPRCEQPKPVEEEVETPGGDIIERTLEPGRTGAKGRSPNLQPAITYNVGSGFARIVFYPDGMEIISVDDNVFAPYRDAIRTVTGRIPLVSPGVYRRSYPGGSYVQFTIQNNGRISVYGLFPGSELWVRAK